MIQEELARLISDADEAPLAKALEDMGPDGWLGWLLNHEAEVLAFLATTAARRKTLKKWQDPVTRPLLVLGAYQLAGLAEEVLHATSYLGGGGSWRDNASAAGAVGLRIALRSVFQWPFSEAAPSGWVES